MFLFMLLLSRNKTLFWRNNMSNGFLSVFMVICFCAGFFVPLFYLLFWEKIAAKNEARDEQPLGYSKDYL